jgi:hypothetical protein
MIFDYLIKYFNVSQEYIFNDIKIIIRIKKEKTSLFKNKKYFISIIVDSDNEIIMNIENIFDFLIEKINEKSHECKKISIHSNWYIFSNLMNVNDFYKINIKKYIRYKNMVNTFALINKTTGEIFFNPEKIENRVLSERMKFLNNDYQKNYPLDNEEEIAFSKEIKDLFDILELMLDDIKSKIVLHLTGL